MSKRVLAIIPAFNEEDCIQSTVEELKRVEGTVDFIIINDGSSDSTLDICLNRGFPVVNLPVNSGLAVGFRTGMKYAYRMGYDYAVQFDADGQHRPEFINVMLNAMEENQSNIVVGSRFVCAKKSKSLRMIGSRIITRIIKLTTGKRISDPTSGLRMYDRSMISSFAHNPHLNPEPETLAMLLRNGAKIDEVQVSMRERQGGESYLNLTKSISYMLRVVSSIVLAKWFR